MASRSCSCAIAGNLEAPGLEEGEAPLRRRRHHPADARAARQRPLARLLARPYRRVARQPPLDLAAQVVEKLVAVVLLVPDAAQPRADAEEQPVADLPLRAKAGGQQ